MKQIKFMMAVIFLATPMFAAAQAVERQPEDNGKQLYTMLCTQCHGTEGDGRGLNAAHMSVQPRSHIDREEMSARTDEELFKVIEQGGKSINKSVLMPAWSGNLDKAQIDALIAYLRVLCCEDA